LLPHTQGTPRELDQPSTLLEGHNPSFFFNYSTSIRNCLIARNEDAGIFYEISYGLHAHDNVIVGNGFAFTPGAWGAAAGISISSSPGCTIERNLILGNKEGFNFREQQRSTPESTTKNPSPSGTTTKSSETTSSLEPRRPGLGLVRHRRRTALAQVDAHSPTGWGVARLSSLVA